ncbi:MAG TPA: zinc finger-like domain-containing protein, partial [Intrasporangium sp.]|uniref:zinc finger-like domain-containing protein n=1 Tax=Intrasporangium sp. TaxID=1925024 RepID=UPI002F92804B
MSATPMPLSYFHGWLATGERGISSEAIVSHLTGVPITPWHRLADYPLDPADFRRCQLLLERAPLARPYFPAMASRSPQWARLVEAWDDIHALIEEDVPGYLNGYNGSAIRGYRLMQRVIAGGVQCDICDGTGQADPCPKCKGT